MTSDYGAALQRRLTIDYDGNIRVYSREHMEKNWYVSWRAKQVPCKVHGICGPNSVCINNSYTGRKCCCLPGYKLKSDDDWSSGCEAKFNLSCNKNESHFQPVKPAEFYGYDGGYYPNSTYKQCEEICSQLCHCVCFQYSFKKKDGYGDCYPKSQLRNGNLSPTVEGAIYVKLPKTVRSPITRTICQKLFS
ncbi:hypothetical protein L6164_028863 [Bauhinia variegata]|uniref:Uncharacterized protein n=1 Tax=Bauhinia variegata TaxID=167791 RepID=A0ACB9L6Y3_BAUVA|nr:hypothetical protein L6164_028863 [Bauhinia variegata]